MKERWPEMLEYQQKVQAMTEEPPGDLNPASCQQGMPCGDTDNCPDPVGCGFEVPPVSEDAYKAAQKFCASRKWGASLIIQIAQLLDDFANNAVDEHIEFYLGIRRKDHD